MSNISGITIGNRRRGDDGIYVGRPSALGNPYVVGRDGDAGTLIQPYRAWLWQRIRARDETVMDALADIKTHLDEHGAVCLVCWCDPAPCHANVIRDALELLDWCWTCEDTLTLHCDDCGEHHCNHCNAYC